MGDKLTGFLAVGALLLLLLVLYEKLPDQRGILIFGTMLALSRRK